MSTQEIVPYAAYQPQPLPSDDEINRLFRLAKGLAASGIYKDARQAEQAFAKLLIGHELGLGVAQSMQGLQFVDGQIQLHYSLLAYLVKSRGFNFRFLRLDDEGVEIEFVDPEGNVLEPTSTYTMEDARKAGRAEKDTYKKHPRNMLIARAMSNGVKWFVQEAFAGVPVYVEGEISPAAELTDGEGTGELVGVELPPEVKEVVARAETLGHARLSERSIWEYWVGSPTVDVPEKVREATATLDELQRRRDDEIPEAQVEPDVPEGLSGGSVSNATFENEIGDALPPSGTYESLGGGSARDAGTPPPGEAPVEVSTGGIAAQEPPEESVDVKALRDLRERLTARRKLYEELEATTPEEQADKDKELDGVDQKLAIVEEKIAEAATREAEVDPNQGSLL